MGIVSFNQLHPEVIGNIAYHGNTITPQIRIQAASFTIEKHFLIHGMADGFQHPAENLAFGILRVDGSSAVLKGIVLLNLHLTGAGVHGYLAEMGSVGKGKLIGGKAGGCHNLTAALPSLGVPGQFGIIQFFPAADDNTGKLYIQFFRRSFQNRCSLYQNFFPEF